MLSVNGLDNLKFILIEAIKLGQEMPSGDPEVIAGKIIKFWKRKLIRRIK